MPHKIPESVLVVIHTSEMEVLLIERAARDGFELVIEQTGARRDRELEGFP